MAFGTRFISYANTYKRMFQSLFFWNGLWDAALSSEIGSSVMSFNPCFSGMAFGTFGRQIEDNAGNGFQSLFFWNGLWDKQKSTANWP